MIDGIVDRIEFFFNYEDGQFKAYARKYDDGTFDICVGTIEDGEQDNVPSEMQDAAEQVWFEKENELC
jgi:hypothetical protein